MNSDDFSSDFDPTDPYGYRAEDEHFGFSGPLPDDSEPEEPAAAAHPERCGCIHCDPDTHREMAMELAAGRPSYRPWRVA
jgi:hypothetical protein